MVLVASPEMHNYFKALNEEVKSCYLLAAQAREKGLDPEETVPIPLAQNMAERVVGLISVVAPQITQTKVTERLLELEQKYGLLDWRVGFTIAEEIAKQQHCLFSTALEAMEVGIRVGFAYLTLGIVSAPLEGFIGLKIKRRLDGKEYFALQYAGPIRGAGGTAASISVILSDYVRVKMGYAPYDPQEMEIKRSVTELLDYHERVTNLQYLPSEEEIAFMVSHLPVQVDGDPTEKIEVSNYKDLPRIETNLIRGGMALVLAEGLCQKAPKLWKRLSKWGAETGLEWGWLKEFIALKEKVHAAHDTKKAAKAAGEKSAVADSVGNSVGGDNVGNSGGSEQKVQANNTFIMDLVAGRPIITHPLAEGGLRLRYGRTRTTGFSAAGLHPATLMVLDKFIAIGTQLKVERPGKAASVTVCEALEGPIVRLKDGSVLALKTEEEARKINPDVEEILYVGDVLFNYGDFSENGQKLCPVGYSPEWWILELEKAVQEKFSRLDEEELALELGLEVARLLQLRQDYFFSYPSFEEAIDVSRKLGIPLHPDYTFYWKVLSRDEFIDLVGWFQEAKIKMDEIKIDEKSVVKIILPLFSMADSHHRGKKALEHAGIPHKVINKESVILEKKEAQALCFCLNIYEKSDAEKLLASLSALPGQNGLELLQSISPVLLRDKAGTFVGARMGRPEKAKMREMTGSPQAMFPVGEEGDRFRSVQAALKAGKVRSTFPLFYCPACQKSAVYQRCAECKGKNVRRYFCRFCGDLEKENCRHGKGMPYKMQDIDINYYFTKAMEHLRENVAPDQVKSIRGTSNKEHLVENLAKGVLRAKHNIYVNKDGTTRYDCTELPITHFKPKEIGTAVEKLKELGYAQDIYGQELADGNQLLELKPQDLILPGFHSLEESASQVLIKVAKFVDNLLVNFYGLEPFYNVRKEEDLIGHLVIGLAPHISAGMVGRIIGFSETQGLFTHPMYHAGLRRDCVHPSTKFVYEDGRNLKYDEIGKFVEKIIKEGAKTKQIDSFGTLKIESDKEFYVLGVDPHHYKLKRKKVKYFIKAPIPKKWVKITTSTKRSFIMTETHDFMYFSKNKLALKKAHQAQKGDKIMLLNLLHTKDNSLKRKIYKLTYHKKIFNKKYSTLEKKGDILTDEVVKVEFFTEKINSYCLNIDYDSTFDKNIVWGEQIINTRCDGDEAAVMLLMDALLNFSRKFLPNTRGSTMDSPLVLTAVLNPTEIDDQVHGMDTVWKYPLELYEAALQMKYPWEVLRGEKKEKVEQLNDRLGTPAQYEGWGYTHPVENINKGVQCSAYKTAPTMEDKLIGQMEIARKVRAVDMDDVARLVIQKHFLKDIKGNLRKFSMQQFRCVKCSEKYRRPPLAGKCLHCGGKLIFTITEGSVVKYLGPSLMLCEKYNFSPYLKQTLEILKQNVDNIFGKEKEKQTGLGMFGG